MNERLLELYKQAHVPSTAIDPSNNMPYETTRFSADKFAGLIIADVLELTEPNPGKGPYGDNDDYALQCVQRDIKEHFGIEA